MRPIFTALTATALLGISSLAYADGAHACGPKGERGAKGSHVMRLDANGDGKVERAELVSGFAAKTQAHLARVDTNKDGFIDATERETAHQAMKAEHEAKRAEREAQRAARGETGEAQRALGEKRGKHGRGGPGGMEKMLARVDTDSDGRVSLAELEAKNGERIEKMMSRLDTNGDGAISAEEAAAGKGHRGHRG